MVEFSVRIDFYRDPKGPTDYVGSALRDGFTAVVLPRVGEYLSMVGDSHVWQGPDSPTGGPTPRSWPSSTPPPRRGGSTPTSPKRSGNPGSGWSSAASGPGTARSAASYPDPVSRCCATTTPRAAGRCGSSATTPRWSRSPANP